MEPSLSLKWLEIERVSGQRPQLKGDVLSMRQQYKVFTDEANSSCTKSSNLSIEDIKITPHLTARVYRPIMSEGSQPLPVGVYFHGGGWCCGDLDAEDPFCQLVAENLPCVIVSVEYRLAPEYKNPTQLEDVLEGWNWAFRNASKLKGDSQRYFVIGQSAGGHLALALVNKLVYLDRQGEVRGIAALVPVAAHPEHIPAEYIDKYRSFIDCANAPVITAPAVIEFFDSVGASPQDPDFFVINSATLDRFPATYLAVCDVDPIRDDGLIIHDALNKAGVPTKIKHYVGLPHIYWAFGCPAPSGTFLGDVLDGINFAIS
ncbi:hypothetical protein N7532_005418 [Penicillium argentinense]|uniref:Alpha/beta hydrolase fold-3 domain-containing protein n=1 Tax=Penicillium argentinense TaxID=1131581 RepID=A0A9W9KAW3_9EURO|nr:uncharacterized protein N7532_005418 [Penicillium argentinense]KAJ5098417.1 hypothetical protein N7532_005418 [Penicillium argentinense]